MHSLSWVRSAAAVISDATPLGGPSTGSGDVSISTVVRLSLTELEPLARPRPARLLPLDDPRIARQQSLLPQLLAMPLVRQAQRPRDRESHRPRLPRHPAPPAQRPHVEGTDRVRRRERLLDVRHERRPGKVVAQRPPVDVPLPRARREIHARHAHLAAPDRVPPPLRRGRPGHLPQGLPSAATPRPAAAAIRSRLVVRRPDILTPGPAAPLV